MSLTGITKPNAWVAISGEEDDYIVNADEKGSFEADVDLIAGINEIVVISFDENGNTNTQKLIAVFSSEFK
jgi:hypothetical protein